MPHTFLSQPQLSHLLASFMQITPWVNYVRRFSFTTSHTPAPEQIIPNEANRETDALLYNELYNGGKCLTQHKRLGIRLWNMAWWSVYSFATTVTFTHQANNVKTRISSTERVMFRYAGIAFRYPFEQHACQIP
ncbi:unnamed protein product, partial [Dicrocoelium dendriticum]